MREALDSQVARLSAELAEANPVVIVTLGNAAMRVLRQIVAVELADDSGEGLRAENGQYGRPVRISFGGCDATWYPLAHPAAPPEYQTAHERWVTERSG